MASEVQAFQVVSPFGTVPASGFFRPLTMPARIVERLEVRVPPGPRGEVGFSIGAAGTPILPVQLGTFIVTDNEIIDWPLENQIDSGGWSLFGYNTGRFDHTIYIRFLLQIPQLQARLVTQLPIPPDRLLALAL